MRILKSKHNSSSNNGGTNNNNNTTLSSRAVHEYTLVGGSTSVRQASSDLTSLSLTETSYSEEGPRRSVLLWRHVRMIVRGVRGVRGVRRGVVEGSRLEDTVVFRAAR